MSEKLEIMSPMRLTTYRDEPNNNEVFQWVLGEYESNQITYWKNILDGSAAIIQDVHDMDPVKRMFFVVTKNTTDGGATLTTFNKDVPETDPSYGLPTLTLGGTCTRGGDVETFDITEEIFNLNALSIYKNGSKLQPNTWVYFEGVNKLRFTNRLQVGDIILIERIVGV